MTGKVKIVKKGDIQLRKPAKVVKTNTQRATAREMVSTVTDWVSDFKERKSRETKAAFEMLFVAQAQPSES